LRRHHIQNKVSHAMLLNIKNAGCKALNTSKWPRAPIFTR
jgi:hypothetical protein